MFVYFIQAGDDGSVKIGISADPERRLELLQGAHYEELVLLAYRPGTLAMEKRLHSKFAAWRIRGEWFEADAPGLREEIDAALDVEDSIIWNGGRLCIHCGVEPVRKPRTKVCSDACATARKRSITQAWKESRRC